MVIRYIREKIRGYKIREKRSGYYIIKLTCLQFHHPHARMHLESV